MEHDNLEDIAELIHDLKGVCKSEIIEEFYEIYHRLDSITNKVVTSAVDEFITTYRKVNKFREEILNKDMDESMHFYLICQEQ